MPYTRAKVERYINRVRDYMDHVPMSSEDVSGESEAESSASTSIPDDMIIQGINAAQDAIVTRCKAAHVYDTIQTDTGTTTPTSEAVRLLYGSQKRNGSRAVFREVSRARSLESTGQAGTNQYPAFTYDGGEVIFYPEPDYSGGDSTEVRYVSSPAEVSSKSDTLDLDERFEAAIVYYTAAECFTRIRDMQRAQRAKDHFEDEIQAYSLGARTSRVDNPEVASD